MVAVSGGKDSYALLHVLMKLRERAPIDFELVAVNLDQGSRATRPRRRRPLQGGRRPVPDALARHLLGGEAARPRGQDHLPGLLAAAARRALQRRGRDGLHQDRPRPPPRRPHRDAAALGTLLGRAEEHAAALRSLDGRNVVIRPLCYAAEEEIAAFADAMAFPIVPCDLCGSQPNLRRKRVKRLLAELSAEHPSVKGNLLHALGRVVPSHLLDRALAERTAQATGADPWLDAEDGRGRLRTK